MKKVVCNKMKEVVSKIEESNRRKCETTTTINASRREKIDQIMPFGITSKEVMTVEEFSQFWA